MMTHKGASILGQLKLGEGIYISFNVGGLYILPDLDIANQSTRIIMKWGVSYTFPNRNQAYSCPQGNRVMREISPAQIGDDGFGTLGNPLNVLGSTVLLGSIATRIRRKMRYQLL